MRCTTGAPARRLGGRDNPARPARPGVIGIADLDRGECLFSSDLARINKIARRFRSGRSAPSSAAAIRSTPLPHRRADDEARPDPDPLRRGGPHRNLQRGASLHAREPSTRPCRSTRSSPSSGWSNTGHSSTVAPRLQEAALERRACPSRRSRNIDAAAVRAHQYRQELPGRAGARRRELRSPRRARSMRSSARTAPASRRWSRSCPASTGRTAARSASTGATWSIAAPDRGAGARHRARSTRNCTSSPI